MNEAATTWALVVGIDQYDSEQVPALGGAVADALAAVSWLRALGVPDDQILLNASASAGSESAVALSAIRPRSEPARQANIAASVHTLTQVLDGTRLLVFLCGHGYYEPTGGAMFLMQDFDVAGQWPNLGINLYVQKFLSLPFRRQFLFMDGCLSYPYDESLRQRFVPMGPIGQAAAMPLERNTMVTCFASAKGEYAEEMKKRGVFLSTLLPQLNPANPVPDYPDALLYNFDDGSRTVDLAQLIGGYVSGRVTAATGGAQHPQHFTGGFGGSADGAHLFRVLPDPATVAVSLTVAPSHAAAEIKKLSVWLSAPPYRSKYLYQPPKLPVPVHVRLPRDCDANAECELSLGTQWETDRTHCQFRADADQTVLFTLTPHDDRPSAEPGTRLGVKFVALDGKPISVLHPAEYDQASRDLGFQGSPDDGQPVAEGVSIYLHEDGPEFRVTPAAAATGADTAAAWAQALRAVMPRRFTITRITSGGASAISGKLSFQLPPGGAVQLAGPLAGHPSVVIERGLVTRPSAWRLDAPEAAGNFDGVEMVLSLSDLAEQPLAGFGPGPVRVSVELPWGSWSTTALAPASGMTHVELPVRIGVPPLRVPLTDELRTLAELDASGRPVILTLRCDDAEETRLRPLNLGGTEVVIAGESGSFIAWSIPQQGLFDVLLLEGHRVAMFPVAGRSLAIDDADGRPRVEPLSAIPAPEWDLLIGTGQLDALSADHAFALAETADDELLRLAGAYVLYAHGELEALQQVLPPYSRWRHIDNALLWLAAINRTDHTTRRVQMVMNAIRHAARRGQVPVLRWGIDLALDVLPADLLDHNPGIRDWHAGLAAIRPRLAPRSVWTTWTEGRSPE